MSQALMLSQFLPVFIDSWATTVSTTASSTCSAVMSSYYFVECYITNTTLISFLEIFFIDRIDIYWILLKFLLSSVRCLIFLPAPVKPCKSEAPILKEFPIIEPDRDTDLLSLKSSFELISCLLLFYICFYIYKSINLKAS